MATRILSDDEVDDIIVRHGTGAYGDAPLAQALGWSKADYARWLADEQFTPQSSLD